LATALLVAGAGLASGSSSTPDSSATIAAGWAHSCALTSAGGLACWGDGVYGQLGDGTGDDHLKPVGVLGLSTGVRSVISGDVYTCAILSTRALECWGDNETGQLGDGSTSSEGQPVGVSGLSSGVEAVAAGGDRPSGHTCAVLSGGAVKCWGDNEYGQLGDRTTKTRHAPVAVSGLSSGVEAVAAGTSHTCALLSSGGVECWGSNGEGELGDGTTNDRHVPVPVSGLSSGVEGIAANGEQTCAVLSTGAAECWGYNAEGQLGDGTTKNRAVPVAVAGLSGVRSIAAGVYHTCALLAGGGVECWGDNEFGQLGDGTTTARLRPVAVGGLPANVQAIAAGDEHSCALMKDRSFACWGSNHYGQLGNGKQTYELSVFVYGRGTVRGKGFRCGDYCDAEYAAKTKVALKTHAAKGWVFSRWRDDCKSRKRKRVCTLIMNSDALVTARFTKRRG